MVWQPGKPTWVGGASQIQGGIDPPRWTGSGADGEVGEEEDRWGSGRDRSGLPSSGFFYDPPVFLTYDGLFDVPNGFIDVQTGFFNILRFNDHHDLKPYY
jgi:hypothetical protein